MPYSTQPTTIKEDYYDPWQDKEIEKIPSKDLIKTPITPIIRGGFIDSTTDAQDLGLVRLFAENNPTDKPCIDTPTTSSTLNEESPNKHSIDLPLESDDKFSPFTPNTLEYLEYEIKKNKLNLDELEKVCKHPEIVDDVREKLLDERKYYVSQQAKHMNSILEIAKKTEINDIDADKLLNEINKLKENVDKLFKDSESIKQRTLTESNKSNLND